MTTRLGFVGEERGSGGCDLVRVGDSVTKSWCLGCLRERGLGVANGCGESVQVATAG